MPSGKWSPFSGCGILCTILLTYQLPSISIKEDEPSNVSALICMFFFLSKTTSAVQIPAMLLAG